VRQAVCRDRDHDLAHLQQLTGTLGVAYSWLPLALLIDFVAQVQGELTGDAQVSVVLEPPAVANLPISRRPKRQGDYIERDAMWFYRAEIQQPPDTVYAIAKEHALAAHSAGVHPSVVQNAIARVKALLALLESSDRLI
jgi:hypothetical protein